MKLQNRILDALKYSDLTVDELCNTLCVDRNSVNNVLKILKRERKVHRRFFHNRRLNKPDYLYSVIEQKSKYLIKPQESLNEIIGIWDSLDITQIKK